jgi:hypothetical protein
MKELELKYENFTFLKNLICGFIADGPSMGIVFL